MRTLYLKQTHINETLEHLQEGGRQGAECVVLWLGREQGDSIFVEQVYRPEQWAESDIFRIPAPSMRSVMNMLALKQLIIAAQVHSHPYEAFHSRADDEWAIVRHVNALSLVVPHFALKTKLQTFFNDMKTFRLTPENRWVEIPEVEVPKWLRLS